MGCGIYKIKNLINNKCYIGSSVNTDKRIKNHKIMLLGGYHNNEYLQNSVLKHGIENFSFEVVSLCDEAELIYRSDLNH